MYIDVCGLEIFNPMKNYPICLSLLFCFACQHSGADREPETRQDPWYAGRIIDLTHSFDSTTIYWPTEEGFRLEKSFEGFTEKGYFYEANSFYSAEHGGTHLDAPVHFAEGKQSVEEIPLEKLIGPAIVIDVSDSCREKYLGTVAKGASAVEELQFPGIHPDAAQWLVDNRNISAAGIDTPSIDYGQSDDFKTHQILYEQNFRDLKMWLPWISFLCQVLA